MEDRETKLKEIRKRMKKGNVLSSIDMQFIVSTLLFHERRLNKK